MSVLLPKVPSSKMRKKPGGGSNGFEQPDDGESKVLPVDDYTE
jgi:hypothetical protein